MAAVGPGKVGVITQARTTSTRLPGKVLLEAGGRTLLDHHLDRLLAAGLEVYVATTVNATDDPIVALAEARGLGVYRGSEEDVLARFTGCAEAFGLDTVVRVTSDCPLIDGALVRRAIDLYAAAADPWTYVSNGLERTFPRGFDLEVFSAEALLDAGRNATEQPQREHVTPYLYANGSGRMTLRNLARTPDGSSRDAASYRVTLDTEDDLRLIRALIEDHRAAELDVEGVIAVLDAHPELAGLNAHVEQKKLGQ
ncbi:cytidylyltransferase domain-containing protein [Marmoricola sp. RAF53]|uniref:cytidylyltransferase domain-containing protein n=1 Tax=Marmoricola sp. RAF53 TaxID=3233059 RepID=UPI003F98B81F